MRIALGIEYDGSHFYGFQSQKELNTIQACIEAALTEIAGHPVAIVCAGRTDTGVHATAQVIHFETEASRKASAWLQGTNSILPKHIAVQWIKDVPDDFHARYSAITRSYRYIIYSHPTKPALYHSHVTWYYRKLNHERMATAAQCLIGTHDFTSFRSSACQSKTPIRCIHAIEVIRTGPYVIVDLKANAFLHHMVRNIAGVLMAVGACRQDVAWVQHVLDGKDRRLGAETASPYGLYLSDIQYPEHYEIPKSPHPLIQTLV